MTMPQWVELHIYKIQMLVSSQFPLIKYCIEKVLHGQASGDGIKRTPAYETPYTKIELDKWRKEFWGKFQLFIYFIIRSFP